MKKSKATVIAYYLPQFHEIEENNKWWGEGFTEWTNVKKCKPFFKNHKQPKKPGELGYYNLLDNKTRVNQSLLAKEAGVDAFCYWHYWFGNGKMLLEKPLQEVIHSNEPDLPFCLAWANHSWYKKHWNNDVSRLSKELLIEQKYPGEQDIRDHFYKMLPAFKDKRYFKIKDKLVFVIYSLEDLPYSEQFITIWKDLAKENDLPGFYFIAHTASAQDCNNEKYKHVDAINLHIFHQAFEKSMRKTKINTILSFLLGKPLRVREYAKAMKSWTHKSFSKNTIYPTIYPNWDNSPRFGSSGTVLVNSTPAKFKEHVKEVLSYIKDKPVSDQVIFIKSWNEWAEGNYMEPDAEFGKGYIYALNEALNNN